MDRLPTTCACVALSVFVAAHASSQSAEVLSSRAKKGDFDASGVIDCRQSGREAAKRCAADIVRGVERDAVVAVTFPNGFRRILTFEAGQFLRADTTMSGTGTDTETRVENGTHHVRVDGQRYALPDGLVFGN